MKNLVDSVESIFDEKYYKVFGMGKDYTTGLVIKILNEAKILDCIKSNQEQISINKIIEKLDFSRDALPALYWLLEYSSSEGILNSIRNQNINLYSVADYTSSKDIDEIQKEILINDVDWEPFIKIMSLIANEYPAFLKGKISGVEMLFSGERTKLWNDYFANKYSAYRAYNEMGALVLLKEIELMNRSVSIAELGGGSGGATMKFLDGISSDNLLNNITRYVFTDISPIFLRKGNQILMQYFDDDDAFDTNKLDINKSFSEQGILNDESVNIVYCVNVLHIAKNLVETLKEIRKALTPGGKLVFCEVLRPDDDRQIFLELIFNLLDSYTNVELNSDYRPVWGFLKHSDWEKALSYAGFNKIKCVMDHGFSQSGKNVAIAIAIIGEK